MRVFHRISPVQQKSQRQSSTDEKMKNGNKNNKYDLKLLTAVFLHTTNSLKTIMNITCSGVLKHCTSSLLFLLVVAIRQKYCRLWTIG